MDRAAQHRCGQHKRRQCLTKKAPRGPRRRRSSARLFAYIEPPWQTARLAAQVVDRNHFRLIWTRVREVARNLGARLMIPTSGSAHHWPPCQWSDQVCALFTNRGAFITRVSQGQTAPLNQWPHGSSTQTVPRPEPSAPRSGSRVAPTCTLHNDIGEIHMDETEATDAGRPEPSVTICPITTREPINHRARGPPSLELPISAKMPTQYSRTHGTCCL